MNPSLAIAIITVAICSISTGAIGQSGVYRCGNSYSQKPCTDAVVVDVQDSRTPDQKVQAEATIRRDTATGNAMEKARLAQEARQRTAQDKLTAAERKQSASNPKKAATPVDTTETNTAKSKRKKSTATQQKAKSQVFIASTPGEKTKPGARPGNGP